MLQVHHICKSYGIETILSEVSFTLSRGERLGLIGPNGSGKTTLLRILAGVEQPDTGQCCTPRLRRLGYLPQGFSGAPAETLGSYLARTTGDPKSLEAELAKLAECPERRTRGKPRFKKGTIGSWRSSKGFIPMSAAAPSCSPAWGWARSTRITGGALSGGQKTRLALALVLLVQPQLLLLDEPTNHLDIEMLEWLEDWLADFPARR